MSTAQGSIATESSQQQVGPCPAMRFRRERNIAFQVRVGSKASFRRCFPARPPSALQTDVVSTANQVRKVPTEVIRSRERFDVRRHVGNACDPVVRVAASKNPNAAVWSRPLIILLRTKRLFASEPLGTNLSRQYSLQRFGRNLLRPHLGAEKNGNDSQEQ
jgi:hypothetical protein